MAEVWWTESARSVRDSLSEEDQQTLRELLASILEDPVPGSRQPVDSGLRSLGVLGSRYVLFWQDMVDGGITVVRLSEVTSERGG